MPRHPGTARRSHRAEEVAREVQGLKNKGHENHHTRLLAEMPNKMVKAPAYFGESCLWVPFEQWNTTIRPVFLYSCRSATRGELLDIHRDAVQTVIMRFSPWMQERFELFRLAVTNQHLGSEEVDTHAPMEHEHVPLGNGKVPSPRKPSHWHPDHWVVNDVALQEGAWRTDGSTTNSLL